MSVFIERSKSPLMTQAVEDHFFGVGAAAGSNRNAALPGKGGSLPMGNGAGVNYNTTPGHGQGTTDIFGK